MSKINSIYFVEPQSQGWIIEKLVDDIVEVLDQIGIQSSRGIFSDYSGEDVIFNTRFLSSNSDSRAKINSIFVTHIDDVLKEVQFKFESKKFESIICLSQQDCRLASQLLGREHGLIGINLPPRSVSVRPIKLAYFSSRYQDQRKNEIWLKEYFLNHNPDAKKAFVISFLGRDWERFCEELGDVGVSYEIVQYSTSLSAEYELYKEKLSQNDYLIYLGFDGGAMSVYDGLGAGLRVICPNSSYHQGLSERVELFDEKEDFFAILDELFRQYSDTNHALAERSVQNYVQALLSHWDFLLPGDNVGSEEVDGAIESLHDPLLSSSKEKRRYHRLSLSRIRSALIRLFQKLAG